MRMKFMTSPSALLALLAALVFGTMACSPSTEQAPVDGGQKTTLPAEVRDDVERLLTGYYLVKDAMVTSDTSQVKAAADSLLAFIELFDTNGLDEETSVRLTNEVDAVRYGAQNISEASGIDAQREYLPALTENLITLVTAYNVADATVYKQYCPMAFNNRGAYWLSSEEQVVNPYFGDVMLHCGEVRERL